MRPLTILTALQIAALPATAACAQEQRNRDPASVAERQETRVAAMPATPPKLIIAIAVDQFSADLFNEYRGLFRGGLARLATQGVVFSQGYQAHGATETCPGHSTILTGSHPARTGIIANNWFDQSLTRDDKRVYCAEDPAVADSASASGRYAPSIQYLRMPTLGDRMRAANPAAQVVSVAGKDRAAIMLGGRQANMLWWLAPTGLTSYRGTAMPADVARISDAIARAIAAPAPIMSLPAACAARDIAVPVGSEGRTVGAGRLAREGGNFRAFLASPEADGAVLAAAAQLRADRRLGQGSATDLLTVGLSATDYVGHSYGTEGAEMCIQLINLDRSLGDFLARMDATGIDYAVVLTADHGGHDLPERNRANAVPGAVRTGASLAPEAVGDAVKAALGLTIAGPLLLGDGPFGDYYVSRSVPTAQRARVVRAATTLLTADPAVEKVVTAATLRAMPMPTRSPELWTVEERLRASFDPARSGDFLVVLKPRVTPIAEPGSGYVATHGSVWDYDRRVPILFWRAGMAGFEQPNPVKTVDILPTIAALIRLPLTGPAIDGHCLDLVAGPGTTCPTP